MSASRTDAVISEAEEVVAQALAEELTITFDRGDVIYEGTAAQLQAEGLIPDDLEWPTGRIDRHWCTNGFRYWLHRVKPADVEWLADSWLDLDSWRVSVQPERYFVEWARQFKAEAPAREVYHQILEAQRKRLELHDQVMLANKDKAFQGFKSIIVLEPKKLGRKPKSKAGKS